MTAASLSSNLLALEDMLGEAVNLNHALWLSLTGISDKEDQAALQTVCDCLESRLAAIVASVRLLREEH